MAAGIYSNDKAAMGWDKPRSTSSSKPSTSILQNAGTPYFAISSSSVVTGTVTVLSQATALNEASRCTALIHSGDMEVTVGVIGRAPGRERVWKYVKISVV